MLSMILLVAAVAGCSGQQEEPSQGTSPQTETNEETGTTGTAEEPRMSRTGANTYRVRLQESNGSGVTGEATVTIEGTSTIVVAIRAEGLTPGEKHPQHIHGFRNGADSRLPARGSDRRLTDVQAERFIGPPLISLDPYPEAGEDGTITYRRTFKDVSMYFPLDGRAIELHGMEVDGEYDFTMPVAVGLLEPVDPTEGFNEGEGGVGGSPGAGGGATGGTGGTESTGEGTSGGTGSTGGGSGAVPETGTGGGTSP